MSERMDICKNCKFWQIEMLNESGNPIGTCRRNSPVIVDWIVSYRDSVRAASKWPWSEGHEWCGEYQPRSNDE